MKATLVLLSYLNANFAMKYLLWYTSMILFPIKFSILTPLDTLNLAVRCSPSYTYCGQKPTWKPCRQLQILLSPAPLPDTFEKGEGGKVESFLASHTSQIDVASNGGCCREEKSHKHWSLFTLLLSSVCKFFFFCYFKSKEIIWIDCTENHRKIELSQMS